MLLFESWNSGPPSLKKARFLTQAATGSLGNALLSPSPTSVSLSFVVRCVFWSKQQEENNQSWRIRYQRLSDMLATAVSRVTPPSPTAQSSCQPLGLQPLLMMFLPAGILYQLFIPGKFPCSPDSSDMTSLEAFPNPSVWLTWLTSSSTLILSPITLLSHCMSCSCPCPWTVCC